MKVFTYKDYIKAIHSLRLNEIFKVAEKSIEYQLNEEIKEENEIEDKLVRIILANEEKMAKVINTFVDNKENLRKENLVKYKPKKYKLKQPDVIYKIKNQEKYYIVEYLNTIDESIPYRMLNYCIDIIYEWSRDAKIKVKVQYPIVIPIVIYTGKENWKLDNNKKERSATNNYMNCNQVKIEYNLIEVNKLLEEFIKICK